MNLLSTETSPYLLLHKDNPVHWWPWGEKALAAAQAANKPILLSVGYSACHWCHVMAHESFEDPHVADIMNAHFICIKVDREERPDIDMLYQEALAAMGQQGGWPLTLFLTPKAEPFYGGTYFPPLPRGHLPSFTQVLQGIAHGWQAERAKINFNVETLTNYLREIDDAIWGQALTQTRIAAYCDRLVGHVDHAYGGLGAQGPKFPSVPVFDLLWRQWGKTKKESYRAAVLETLNNLCQGGIYDHLGGGFARYAVDRQWRVPHFEKMLADNAQILALLTEVWRVTQNQLLEKRIHETAAFIINDFRVGKAFAGSFSADSEGIEGKFYTWTHTEILEALGEDAALFCQYYDVSPEGNWERVTILNRLNFLTLGSDETEARLSLARDRLKALRAQRLPPLLDDKILTDWNGLTIAALAQAGFAFDQPRWLKAAQEAFDFFAQQEPLLHSWCKGKPGIEALLDDYASMIHAALALYEATGTKSYLDKADQWMVQALMLFYDEEKNGFFQTAVGDETLLARRKVARDTAQASGNALMVDCLVRLGVLCENSDYLLKADFTVQAFGAGIFDQLWTHASLVAAADLVQNPVLIDYSGAKMAEVLRKYKPYPCILKHNQGDTESLKICIGQSCLLHITDWEIADRVIAETLSLRYAGAANDS